MMVLSNMALKFVIVILAINMTYCFEFFEEESEDDLQSVGVRLGGRSEMRRSGQVTAVDPRPRIVYVTPEAPQRTRREDQVEFSAGTDRHGVYRLSMSKGILESLTSVAWLLVSLIFGLAGIRGAQVYRRGNEPLNAYGPRLAGQNPLNPFL